MEPRGRPLTLTFGIDFTWIPVFRRFREKGLWRTDNKVILWGFRFSLLSTLNHNKNARDREPPDDSSHGPSVITVAIITYLLFFFFQRSWFIVYSIFDWVTRLLCREKRWICDTMRCGKTGATARRSLANPSCSVSAIISVS